MKSLVSFIIMIMSVMVSSCNQVEINADALKKSRLVGSASNHLNSLPVAVNDGPYYVMANGSITINVLGDNLATGGYDPDSDADGDTLSHTSLTNGTKGNTTYAGSNITYTASPWMSGKDTFTYTISDGKGGSGTGTVSIYIISGFTWFGGVDSDWNNPANWCGTINATKTSCTSGSTLPGISDTVNFNGACINCNVNINTNVDVAKFNIDPDFTGTITQNSFSVKARTSFIQSGGTFNGGSGNIDVTDTFQLLNGTFTSTSAQLKVFHDQSCCGTAANNVVIASSATFNHHNGTVIFSSSSANGNGHHVLSFDANTPNVTFYNLTIDGFDADIAAGGSDDTVISIRSGTTITVQNTYNQIDGRVDNGTINILGNAVFGCASVDVCSDGGEYGVGNFTGYPSTILMFNGSSPLIQTIEVHATAAVPSLHISGTSTVTVVSDTNDLSISGYFKQTSGVFNAPSGWINMLTHSQNCCSGGNTEGFRILGGTFNTNNFSLALYGQNLNSNGGNPTIGVVEVPLALTVKDFIYAHEAPWSFSHWNFASTSINVTGDFRFVDGYMDGNPTFTVKGNVSFECAGGDVCAENSPGIFILSGTTTQTLSQAAGAGLMTDSWTVDKPGSVLSLATDLFLINPNQDLLLLDDSQIDMNGFNLTNGDGSFPTHNTLYMFSNTLINRGVTPGTLTYETIYQDPSATINPP